MNNSITLTETAVQPVMLRKNCGFISFKAYRQSLGLPDKKTECTEEQKALWNSADKEFQTAKFTHQRENKAKMGVLAADSNFVVSRVTPRLSKSGDLVGATIVGAWAKTPKEKQNGKLAAVEAENAMLKARLAALEAKVS